MQYDFCYGYETSLSKANYIFPHAVLKEKHAIKLKRNSEIQYKVAEFFENKRQMCLMYFIHTGKITTCCGYLNCKSKA
jgi:hypothetical protein